ncbi:NAD(P)/FAD-dependent oxidoreductase [Herbidospora sp. NBRC 101105]|uniref:FAD-dependent oxidoreductase n=1 Tax=Herbidospora sp. NBRC 101105 TaxID=3032195 RepID=UPI0024A178AB|nr:NAD(P)/FAD-dependent oxidoreductase [Herbidospora sp. NBRC 101105]GLX97326.1 FAD-dependent oxidoreductase [Herbidospora sp. NBRC 101105]
MTKDALIIGGGIAGPVTAMALRKAGLGVRLFEAYDRGSDGVGAFLTLARNGLEALKVLDLHDLVAHLGMDTPEGVMVNAKGRELAVIPQPSRTLRRGDLYRALRDEAVRRGVSVEYGKRLTDAASVGGGVQARFEDGTTADGALLIGADGLWSRTRTIIDPAAPRPRHLGLLNTGGFAEGVRVPGRPGVSHFVFGRRCFFGYLVHPDGGVWWFANPASPKEPTAADLAAVTPSALMELFRDDAGPMRDIIAATPHVMPAWNTYDLPTVPNWSNSRMVIVGDAAHATSPSSGQGASMAIEDAVVLARCLRDHDVHDAFAVYERLRRARVERIVAQGKRNGDGKAPGPVGAYLRDLFLPVVLRQVAKRGSLSWMYDHRIAWDESV